MAQMDQLFQAVRAELGADFIATDIVGMDGLSIGGISADPNADQNVASARFAMIMKLALKVSEKLGLGIVEDNLVISEKAMFITRFLGDGSYYWGVAVVRDATLGSVRMVMNEYAPQLWDVIPH